MSIEEKLVEKFEPHAKRIQSGQNNEYDFLPAALLENLKADRESLDRLHALINASGDQAKIVKKEFDALTKKVALLKSLAIVNVVVSLIVVAAIIFLKR
jgi:hypothetical protein